MKKTVKFLTLLLALVMALQVAPIASVGVFAEEAEGDQGTVQSGETVTEESGLTVSSMEWRDASKAVFLTPLTDGMTLDCNYLLVRLTLNDIPDTAEVKVDGASVATKIVKKQVLVYVELLNGYHHFEFTCANASGTVTKSFFVNVEGTDSSYPVVKAENPDSIIVGAANELVITGENLDKVGKILVNVSMTPVVKVKSVDLAKGIVGTYSWYRGALQLNLEVFDTAKLSGDVLATVTFSAPAGLEPDAELSWSVDSMEITPAEGETLGNTDVFQGTFSHPENDVEISGGYTVENADPTATDSEEQTLIVKDPEGNPVAGVPVYGVIDGEDVLLGVTDENGQITTDDFKGQTSFDVYVEDENGVGSFTEAIHCYKSVGPEDGTPYGLLLGGGFNGKTFTWMSHIVASGETPMVSISASADMADAEIYNGESMVQYYHTSQAVNRVNTVTVADLAPGVYYYQVGDGNVWSEVKAFTVKATDTAVNFVFTANSDVKDLALVAGAVANSGIQYDFAIQPEDVIADADDYNAWTDAMNAVAGFGGADLIHADARKDGGFLFNNSAPYAKYAFGDVFVAVVNYNESYDDFVDIRNQLSKDSKAYDYEWRILIVNRSSDVSDTTAANEIAIKYLSGMVQNAGIDLVISGDGNVYNRSEPMINGVVTDKNGTVYVVCGASPEKAAVNAVHSVTETEYNALYLSVTADQNGLTLTANDVQADGSVKVVDTFTMVHTICTEDSDHLYRFSSDYKNVVCDFCGHTVNARTYTGLIAMSNYYMYMIDGNLVTGWVEHNGKTYYFSPKALAAVNGVQKIGTFYYVFEDYVLVEGAIVEIDGVRKIAWGGRFLTDTWHTQGGKTYYLLSDGACAVGTVEIPTVNENGETVTETYIFGEDGALIGKA